MNEQDKNRLIEELRQQFIEEGCCPVCNQKKRPGFTEERKKRHSEAMKVSRKRVSPTTTKILVSIMEGPEEFTISGIAKETKSNKNTVREIVRRLIIAGEVELCGDIGDDRRKSAAFGKANFWKELKKEGNVALKSLPK